MCSLNEPKIEKKKNIEVKDSESTKRSAKELASASGVPQGRESYKNGIKESVSTRFKKKCSEVLCPALLFCILCETFIV